MTNGFSLFVASTDVTKGKWKDECGTSSQIHLGVRGRPGCVLAPQLTEHSAWCRDSHVSEVVRAMWRRWRMSSRTSTLLSTSGHTKTHFNEQLKVRLAHFRPSVTPTATAGQDVPSMPSWPVCSGSAPLWTRRLPMDYLRPRCVVTSRSDPDVIAEDHGKLVRPDPCCGRGHLRIRESTLHFGVTVLNPELQGRMWGTKSISCVASARPAAPMKSNPAVTSRLETTPGCPTPPCLPSFPLGVKMTPQ